jgi:hypothetical protein
MGGVRDDAAMVLCMLVVMERAIPADGRGSFDGQGLVKMI